VNRRREVALAGHIGDEDTALEALGDPDPSVRATALGALARLGLLGFVQVEASLSDSDAKVRARAADLAAAFGSDGVGALISALADPDDRVVEAASFALGEVGPAAAPAVEDLGRVTRDHRDPLCREAAVAALGAVGVEAGLAAILAATNDKPAIRRRAILALAPFSGPEVDAALERALEDRDWQVRQAAEDLTS
jgi:HEAT repeat protein